MTRLPAAVAVIATLAAGLGIRAWTDGPLAKYGGVALYTVLVYTLIILIRPRTRPRTTAAIALALSWAVEFAQLTPVPAALSAQSTLARLILGSTYHPPDLLAYALGALLALAVHAGVARRRSSVTRSRRIR
ncbi:DUF2809 domain-containing protein [Rhizohabitans arisaemae]|uniref:ribosomal maturation YjgA family protein n=1 Tax=Rhizohabitans arisaemae TaxID=2720610 RepID=UPI0024B06B06|nr:DUF2809 domain-containing protein [Rhizohabitans arisaemae]